MRVVVNAATVAENSPGPHYSFRVNCDAVMWHGDNSALWSLSPVEGMGGPKSRLLSRAAILESDQQNSSYCHLALGRPAALLYTALVNLRSKTVLNCIQLNVVDLMRLILSTIPKIQSYAISLNGSALVMSASSSGF